LNEDIEDRSGIDESISKGERVSLARFRVTCEARLLQEELEDIVVRNGNSLSKLLIKCYGTSEGISHFYNHGRADLVVEALSSLSPSCTSDIVRALVIVTMDEGPDTDTFAMDVVPAQSILSKTTLETLHAHSSICKKDFQELRHSPRRYFEKGRLITNATEDESMSATERIRATRRLFFCPVTPRLPPGIIAEIVEVDDRDNTLRWVFLDGSRGGWVLQSGVTIVDASRPPSGRDEEGGCSNESC